MTASRSAPVRGTVAPGFGPVRRAAERVVTAQGRAAFAIAAYQHGELVVDLWGAEAGEHSLYHTWSAIKPVVGTCLLHLLEAGAAQLDTPVSRIWPELHAGREGNLTLRHVLGHAAGLAAVPDPGTLASLTDWDRTVDLLARAEPGWALGSAVGEHAMTFGHLVGELILRLDGRMAASYLAEEIARPLALDLHIGVSPEQISQVVDTSGLDEDFWESARTAHNPHRRSALGTGATATLVNDKIWRSAQVPAVNGYATARALAAFYAHFLSGRMPASFATVAASGYDLVLDRHVTWTAAGGQLTTTTWAGRSVDQVAMGGIGGQWAGAVPEFGLAWAFLTPVMGTAERASTLGQALITCAARG